MLVDITVRRMISGRDAAITCCRLAGAGIDITEPLQQSSSKPRRHRAATIIARRRRAAKRAGALDAMAHGQAPAYADGIMPECARCTPVTCALPHHDSAIYASSSQLLSKMPTHFCFISQIFDAPMLISAKAASSYAKPDEREKDISAAGACFADIGAAIISFISGLASSTMKAAADLRISIMMLFICIWRRVRHQVNI